MNKARTLVVTVALALASITGTIGPAAAAEVTSGVISITPISGSVTPMAGYCDGPWMATDRHSAWVRCYGFSAKYYRVMVEACAGTVGCDTRYGPWRNMGSGTWSERSDSFVWYTNAGYQLGN